MASKTGLTTQRTFCTRQQVGLRLPRIGHGAVAYPLHKVTRPFKAVTSKGPSQRGSNLRVPTTFRAICLLLSQAKLGFVDRGACHSSRQKGVSLILDWI
ncbi:hypothetical protein WJX82_011462 [Trebouxia sp. C0006]